MDQIQSSAASKKRQKERLYLVGFLTEYYAEQRDQNMSLDQYKECLYATVEQHVAQISNAQTRGPRVTEAGSQRSNAFMEDRAAFAANLNGNPAGASVEIPFQSYEQQSRRINMPIDPPVQTHQATEPRRPQALETDQQAPNVNGTANRRPPPRDATKPVRTVDMRSQDTKSYIYQNTPTVRQVLQGIIDNLHSSNEKYSYERVMEALGSIGAFSSDEASGNWHCEYVATQRSVANSRLDLLLLLKKDNTAAIVYFECDEDAHTLRAGVDEMRRMKEVTLAGQGIASELFAEPSTTYPAWLRFNPAKEADHLSVPRQKKMTTMIQDALNNILECISDGKRPEHVPIFYLNYPDNHMFSDGELPVPPIKYDTNGTEFRFRCLKALGDGTIDHDDGENANWGACNGVPIHIDDSIEAGLEHLHVNESRDFDMDESAGQMDTGGGYEYESVEDDGNGKGIAEPLNFFQNGTMATIPAGPLDESMREHRDLHDRSDYTLDDSPEEQVQNENVESEEEQEGATSDDATDPSQNDGPPREEVPDKVRKDVLDELIARWEGARAQAGNDAEFIRTCVKRNKVAWSYKIGEDDANIIVKAPSSDKKTPKPARFELRIHINRVPREIGPEKYQWNNSYNLLYLEEIHVSDARRIAGQSLVSAAIEAYNTKKRCNLLDE